MTFYSKGVRKWKAPNDNNKPETRSPGLPGHFIKNIRQKKTGEPYKIENREGILGEERDLGIGARKINDELPP